MHTPLIRKNQTVPLARIPVLPYSVFSAQVKGLLKDPNRQMMTYFGFRHQGGMKAICGIADYYAGIIHLLSYEQECLPASLLSVAHQRRSVRAFEQEITRAFGITFDSHSSRSAFPSGALQHESTPEPAAVSCFDPQVKSPLQGEVQACSSADIYLTLGQGWWGEHSYAALLGPKGEMVHFRAKDSCSQKWLTLALALRTNEIEKMPVGKQALPLSARELNLCLN